MVHYHENIHLAQGVIFEELISMGALLQKENLEQSQKEAAVAIVQKIQGTELFSLLENYMGDASRKIAELLNTVAFVTKICQILRNPAFPWFTLSIFIFNYLKWIEIYDSYGLARRNLHLHILIEHMPFFFFSLLGVHPKSEQHNSC